MGLLDDVDDVGAVNRAAAHPQEHQKRKQGEYAGEPVGLRCKPQRHLRRIHHKRAEDLPNSPGQRPAQQGACPAGQQGQEGQFPRKHPAQLPARGAQGQKHAKLPGLLPEEEAGSVGGKHPTAQHRQNEHHHHLFSGIPALRQNGENGGRAHHTGVGSDEQHREKGAAPQQRVLPPVFPAEVAVDMGKGLHGLTPFPCRG